MFISESRRSRAIAAALAIVFSGVGVAACGDDDDSSDSSTSSASTPANQSSTSTTAATDTVDGKGIGVAAIGYAVGNAYSDTMVKAAKDQAESIGSNFTSFDGKFDPGAQVKACQDAISSGRYKVIVIGAVSGPAAVPCARAAKAAGVTLVQVGTAIGTDNASLEPTVPGVTISVNNPLDSFTAGTATEVGRACKGLNPCRVVELSVIQTIPDIERSYQKAFKQVAAANPSIKVVADPAAGFDQGGGTKAMQDVLSKGVKFDVLVSQSAAGAEGAAIALKSAGKKLGSGSGEIRVVTAGGDKKEVAAVRNGTYWSTTPTLPLEQGKYGVLYGVMAAKGQQVEKGYDPLILAKLPQTLNQTNIAKYPDFAGEF